MQYGNLVFNHFYLAETGRRYRSLQKIVQPAVEPVTLAEMKRHLRVEHEDEDDLIQGLIHAARTYCELRLDRCLIDTRLEMKIDTFPADIELALPLPPFSPTAGRQEVEITFKNVQLQNVSLSEAEPALTPTPGTFLVNRAATPVMLTPNVNGYWPVTGPIRSAVTIRWWSGYGDSGERVPKGIRHAVMMLVAHWYVQRETVAVNAGNAPSMPYGVDELLSTFAWGSYA